MLKNITLSADEALIKRARDRARQERTTLNESFRRWLARYGSVGQGSTGFESLMKRLDYAKPGRHYSRGDMNER
jgi:hypothetical protein